MLLFVDRLVGPRFSVAWEERKADNLVARFPPQGRFASLPGFSPLRPAVNGTRLPSAPEPRTDADYLYLPAVSENAGDQR